MNAAAPIRPLLSRTPSTALCRSCRRRQGLPESILGQKQQRWTTSHDRKIRTPGLANISSETREEPSESIPRWQRTPQSMQAPWRTRPMTPNVEWKYNEDPEVLNGVYRTILGNEGDRVLDDEVKWLAVTHKSFDHGRRGFNDRLAFIGKRLVDLQTSLAMLNAPSSPANATSLEEVNGGVAVDEYGRSPFQHQALRGLRNLSEFSRQRTLDKERIAQLAQKYKLDQVVRWKPRQVRSLRSSGSDIVFTQALYAIVGAVALQKGGEQANRTIRHRILSPLGVI